MFETDPVCHMQVMTETAAARYDYKGKTYYFCNPRCLERFKANPEQFLGPAKLETRDSKSRISNVIYTCPMHPEVRQTGPGACPKCGMALEPDTIAALSQKIEFTCPMHPEIVRETSGSCPLCGMALEARTISVAEEENPELIDMTRRFWVCALLSLPLLLIAMSEMLPDDPLTSVMAKRPIVWIQMALALPVVIWGGRPFFVR